MSKEILFKTITYESLQSRINEFIALENLTELSPKWTEKNYLVNLPKKFDFSIMMIKEDKIVGFIICSKKGEFIHINRFIVDARLTSLGLGSNLLYAFVKSIKKSFSSISLKVHKNNKAVSFYKKHSFVIDHELDNYYTMKREVK